MLSSESDSVLVRFNKALIKSGKRSNERKIARDAIEASRRAGQQGVAVILKYMFQVKLVCDALYLSCRYNFTSNSDGDDIDASDSDMEMNSADESAEMQELCDEIYSDYLPECGEDSTSESV